MLDLLTLYLSSISFNFLANTRRFWILFLSTARVAVKSRCLQTPPTRTRKNICRSINWASNCFSVWTFNSWTDPVHRSLVWIKFNLHSSVQPRWLRHGHKHYVCYFTLEVLSAHKIIATWILGYYRGNLHSHFVTQLLSRTRKVKLHK
jgi:hypothetical protein